MKRKVFSLLFAALLIVSLAACKTEGYYQQVSKSGSSAVTSSDAVDTESQESRVEESRDTDSSQPGQTPGRSDSPESTKSSSVSSSVKKIDLKTAKFPGVTLKRIIWYDMSQEEKNMVAAWEKQTGAKIQDVRVGFEQINDKIAASIKARDYIDIGFIYGAYFPGVVISGLYQRVNDYIRPEYLVDSSAPEKGGFDMSKMTEYKWKNHFYGLCSYWDVDALALYFRPSVFKQYGLTDPNALASQGKWNWDTFYEAAEKITKMSNKTMYGFSRGFEAISGFENHWIAGAGSSFVAMKNGKPVINFSDPKLVEGLRFFQKTATGNTAVCAPGNSFKDGKAAMFVGGLYDIVNIKKSAAANVKNDWDVAPIPLSPNNKNGKYPADWLKAIGITLGSKNADAVASYALFRSKYKGDNAYEEHLSAAQIKRVEPFYNNVNHSNYGYGALVINHGRFFNEIFTGEDITKVLNDNMAAYQNEIDKTLNR